MVCSGAATDPTDNLLTQRVLDWCGLPFPPSTQQPGDTCVGAVGDSPAALREELAAAQPRPWHRTLGPAVPILVHFDFPLTFPFTTTKKIFPP